MKKLICICLSFILLLMGTVPAFAVVIRAYDSETDELVDSESGDSSRTVRLSNSCYYDNAQEMYVFSTGAGSGDNVACSVYNGQIVDYTVEVLPGEKANIEVYKGDTLLPEEDYAYISEPGAYSVRNADKDTTVLSFTIVTSVTGKIDRYQVPNIFVVRGAYFEGKEIAVASNIVNFKEDGDYVIDYACSKTGVSEKLSLTIDRVAPELEITGVDEDNIARGPVSFGDTEDGSTLRVTVNDQDITDPMKEEYKTAGNYLVYYTDAAGNVSTYFFVMRVFFDVSAWIYVALAVIILLLAIGYRIYIRRKIRVR